MAASKPTSWLFGLYLIIVKCKVINKIGHDFVDEKFILNHSEM